MKIQGDRACYTCGSPDHLMRDCPTALSQNAMLQTGKDCNPHLHLIWVDMLWKALFTIPNLVIWQVPCSQELCPVCHLTGKGLHHRTAGPLWICMETQGWWPSMLPWFRLHLLPFLRMFHLCIVVCLLMGKFVFLFISYCLLWIVSK